MKQIMSQYEEIDNKFTVNYIKMHCCKNSLTSGHIYIKCEQYKDIIKPSS